ncbi:MAG: LCP family protein, partial [Lachnospiraceae bacterium]|nr:LCP family protein [Lachnospiraceae bacterium]
TKLSDVSIIVLADSPYTGLQDLKGKEFGVQKLIDRNNTELTLEDLESKLQETVDIVEYESWKSQAQALYNRDVDAIVINELYRSLILDDFENFDEETRVLDGFSYVEELKIDQNSSKADIKVDTEPFNVYLSGNDSYGKISLEAGRSDVNIIATVNPKTKQILLTTTPRDFYVELPFYGGGYYDKLTHTGMYGLDTSIETLENLYEIEIDYYVRLNFSGFRDIVDALDGVEVYSAHEFTSVKGVYFSQGMNYLNGKEALAFVRERKAFADGDFQRGKNQMAMIEALANKIFSPSILMNYMDLMDSVSSCFITDMPRGKINDLVKMQLNDGAEWTIISNSVMGYGNSRTTYSTGNEPLSCVDPDVGDVALATELILKCMNGEKVVIPDKEAEGIYQGSQLGSIGLNYTTQESSLNTMQSGATSTVTGDSSNLSSPTLEQGTVIGGQDSGNNSSGSQIVTPEVDQSSVITSDSGIVNENSSATDSISTLPETGENGGTETSGSVIDTPDDSAVADPGAENTGTIVQ